ncbi:MAG: DUF1549 domain-containing protein [Planctomycetota bacterium]
MNLRSGTFRLSAIMAALMAAAGSLAFAAEDLVLPSPSLPPEKVIDQLVEAGWKEQGTMPAAPADDFNWLRRVSLDLTGRIPTGPEVAAFAADKSPGKKSKVIESLMASSAFVRHQARELDWYLTRDKNSPLSAYLNRALAEKRGWDRIFKELMLANEADASTKGTAVYLKQKVRDLDRLTNDVSVAFFGVNISCAQCHDHPLVSDWKQDHFYGLKSFFSRTFEVGEFLAERDYGVVRFLPNKGKEKQAEFMFLTGAKVAPPGAGEPTKDQQKADAKKVEEWKKSKTQPPAPSASARAKLVELALSAKEKEFFDKALVNQVWYRMFGHGLVMPLDQMHSENPPSHPELLAWLARDFSSHGYDIPRLIKGMVSSRVYGLSSRHEGGSSPPANQFAVARLKPLTPMQMAVALKLAGMVVGASEVEKKVEEAERSARGLADQFPPVSEDFQVGVAEALFMANGSRFNGNEVFPEGADKLLTAMSKAPSDDARADMAVRGVLARPAVADEASFIANYIKRHPGDPKEACRQVIWSLMASPEFRFNY